MKCPICKKRVDPSPRNRYRPFCSERCRTVDLGAWAVESYRVAGDRVEDREHPDDRARRKAAPGQKPAPSKLPEKT